MSEPKHIRDILPGVLLEIERRMCRYSETHPEGSCRGLNAECHIYKEDNRLGDEKPEGNIFEDTKWEY